MSELVKCHNGHESLQTLWDCPVCVEKKIGAARQLKVALAIVKPACWEYADTFPDAGKKIMDTVLSALKAAEEPGI